MITVLNKNHLSRDENIIYFLPWFSLDKSLHTNKITIKSFRKGIMFICNIYRTNSKHLLAAIGIKKNSDVIKI